MNKVKKNNNLLSLFFICIATSLFTIDMGIIAISLDEISSNFSTDKNVTSWIITVFSITSAIGIISLSFLSQTFGRKNIYIICILGFSIFSACCGLSQTFEQLIIFRCFQGFFGAGLVALSQAFVLDIFSEKNRSKALSAWTFGLLAGPVIGPLLGGIIIEFFNWRLIFFINLPFGLFAFSGLLLFLKKEKIIESRRINYLGFFFLSVSTASLQIFLDRGELLDWFNSYFLIGLLILSSLCLILFILVSISSERPLFPNELFKDRYFIGGLIFAFLFGFILIPPFLLLPIYLQEIQSYPINLIGFILSVSGLGGMAGTLFTSKIISYIGNIKTMLFGLLVFFISNLHVTTWSPYITSSEIIFNSFYRGISISIYYVGLANITYKTLPNQYRTDGTSLFQFLRTIGTGISVAAFITLFKRYNIIHYENFRNLTDYSNQGINGYMRLENFNQQKILNLSEILDLNSLMQSIITDFFLLSISPIFFLPFLFLFYKKK